MPFLPSLPEPTNLNDVIRTFPKGWPEMLDMHDAVLRGESPLSIGEREMIAAYVSGLNRCRYCLNAHSMYAEMFGESSDAVKSAVRDLGGAPIEDRMRPVLAYARALTLDPESVTKSHVEAILAAGWEEEAVADVAMVTALYNFMNRIIIGFGVDPFDEDYARRLAAVRQSPLARRKEANRKELGSQNYRNYGRQLGIID